MSHGVGERLERRRSEEEILGARSSNDGVPPHEREGAHAQGEHEHRQMKCETEFLPGEGLGIDVRRLRSGIANQELQTDGRDGGHQRQQQRKEHHLALFCELNAFPTFLDKHHPEGR